jgi:uncharacterized protein YjiS (DUF1127 family)
MSLATVDHISGYRASDHGAAQSPFGHPFVRRLGLAFYHFLRRSSEAAAMRRARRELLELPDNMIADLGISRSEISSVVRFGAADPTRIPRRTLS